MTVVLPHLRLGYFFRFRSIVFAHLLAIHVLVVGADGRRQMVHLFLPFVVVS